MSAEPLEMRIGWLEGECLASANTSLTSGLPVTVVSLDDKRPIVLGQVVGAASDETCPALRRDRGLQVEPEWSFYELKLSSTVDLGIGVTGDTKTVPGGLDLNADGAAESFTYCASTEGVWFHVWSGDPYQGMPLWSAYNYLGFDVDATCS